MVTADPAGAILKLGRQNRPAATICSWRPVTNAEWLGAKARSFDVGTAAFSTVTADPAVAILALGRRNKPAATIRRWRPATNASGAAAIPGSFFGLFAKSAGISHCYTRCQKDGVNSCLGRRWNLALLGHRWEPG